MLLASVEDLRTQLGFDPMPDVEAQIQNALDNAEPWLASRLGTDFSQGTFTDEFFVPKATKITRGFGQTVMQLSRGFVTSLTSATWSTAIGTGRLTDPQFFTYVPETNYSGPQPGVLDPANYRLDGDPGLIRDNGTWYNQSLVTFVYQAGFPTDAQNADSYDLTIVPKWPQECARLYALADLATLPSITQADIKLDQRSILSRLDTMVGRKVRYAPTALSPS